MVVVEVDAPITASPPHRRHPSTLNTNRHLTLVPPPSRPPHSRLTVLSSLLLFSVFSLLALLSLSLLDVFFSGPRESSSHFRVVVSYYAFSVPPYTRFPPHYWLIVATPRQAGRSRWKGVRNVRKSCPGPFLPHSITNSASSARAQSHSSHVNR